MKHLFYFILFFFMLNKNTCQIMYSLNDDSAYIADLEQILLKSHSDSVKSYTHLKLLIMYRYVDTLKAKEHFRQGVLLAGKNPFLKAISVYYSAHNYYGRLNADTMSYYLKRADSLLRGFKTPDAYSVRGTCWQNLGIIQQIKADEKGALTLFTQKAIPLAILSGDSVLLGKVYLSIAMICMNVKERAKAEKYFDESLSILERTTRFNPRRLELLVEGYISMAENLINMSKLKEAKEFLDKAKAILKWHPESNLYVPYCYTEGIYFDEMGNFQAALKSLDEGILLSQKFHHILFYYRLKQARYYIYRDMGDYEKAVKEMEELCRKDGNLPSDEKMFARELYQIYMKLGNKDQALKWTLKYIALSDSLYSSDYQKQVVDLEARYRTLESEKKIAVLQVQKDKADYKVKENRFWMVLLSIVSLFLLVFAILGWMYFSNNRKLSQQKELNYKQQIVEAEQIRQMQVTKALLQGEEKERKRLARDLHDGLGGLLAGVKLNLSRYLQGKKDEGENNEELNNIVEQLDVSFRELRRIARNMIPESLLQLGLEAALRDMCHSMSNDHLRVEFQAFDIRRDIREDKQVMIYRIVQELVANAVRHSGASEVLVQCSQNEHLFFITVEDNGRGLNKGKASESKGIGLENIQSRVQYLDGKIDFSSEKDEGTTVNIEFYVS